jgi:NAD(P)-dependent dehydrogenase (short-subunit alcohol dehydrogenase family)
MDWMAELEQDFDKIPMRYPELRGKVAIVTGSSRGIGKGIALRLAREGMRVTINSRTAEDVEATTRELKDLGTDVIGIPADQSTSEGVRQILDSTLEAFGTVHLVVNNAANLTRKHVFDVDEALLDNALATNIRGPYLLAHYAAVQMRDAGHGGSIIHISSVGGLRAHWRGLPYDVTKGALDAMTRAMALEMAEHGIRVNGIAPGATLTERWADPDEPRMKKVAARIPLGRFGTGLDIGATVAFLASEDGAYITGQVLYVDGGITAQLYPEESPV